MPNEANLPFAAALQKVYAPPEGIKIFTASAKAEKMLAFWSLKQLTSSQVLRLGQELFRVVLHKCPHCQNDLSAQAVRMSKKEREMVAALASMFKQAAAAPAPSKAPKKQASPAAKPAIVPAVPVQAAAAETPEEELSLEQLDALTQPGGAA